MRLTRSALVTLVLLTLAASPAAAAGPSRDAAARAEHERIVRYWTPQRMASAQPRDFVRAGDGFRPAAKPTGNGKPGGGDASTVTGASWTKGGRVAEAVGKVFFTMGSSAYTCSGSVATDGRSSHSLVLTAAHCAYDETAGDFASNWMFIPAWGQASTAYNPSCSGGYSSTKHGCWTATALVVHHGYATAGGFNTQATVHDFAFAVVGGGGHAGGQLDATVGSFALDVSAIAKGTQTYAFGYPAAGKYKGNTLTYCAGKTIEDAWNDNLTWGLGCTMTGGSSGGPWLASFSEATGVGVLGSLNSYGYSGVKNMYGPKFNSKTTAVYTAADGATSNTIVEP